MITQELAPATHCANVILRRRDPLTGKRQLLVIDSTSVRNGVRGNKETKFPGGTNKGYLREGKVMTRNREFEEETGLRLHKAVMLWIDPDRSLPRYFYLADEKDALGELRSRPMIEDDGEELSAPYWVNVDELGGIIFETHRKPFAEYVQQHGIA